MSVKRFQTMSLRLEPSQEDEAALQLTLVSYRRAMEILDSTTGANLVALHKEAYETIREETGLPSRLATLALRDHAKRSEGNEINDIPLDAKLFTLKGPDALSVATVLGRKIIPYVVDGYRPGWHDFADARLLSSEAGVTILVGVSADLKTNWETIMSNEGILARLGRVIGGVINNTVDAVESANPLAVAQMAIKQIDQIADEARTALGSAIAAAHRMNGKLADLNSEIKDLNGKIATGLEKDREDLARVAIGRQVDLEAQRAALIHAIAQAKDEIEDAQDTLKTIGSAKADAEKRLADAKNAQKLADAHVSGGHTPDNRLSNAMGAIERVTGVPMAQVSGASEIDELGAIQRESIIDARLKALKEGKP